MWRASCLHDSNSQTIYRFWTKKRNPTIHTQSTNHPWNPSAIGAHFVPENIEQDYKRTREIRPGTFSFFTIPTIQQSSRGQIAYVRETGNRSQRQAQSTRIHNPQPGHTVHLSNLQPPKDYPIKPGLWATVMKIINNSTVTVNPTITALVPLRSCQLQSGESRRNHLILFQSEHSWAREYRTRRVTAAGK